MENSYLTLDKLEVYQISREISRISWSIYVEMDWNQRKAIGNQFITAIDSVGANIAEGYGRYHYLDKIKFYYNSRASFFEGIFHWLELLKERNLIDETKYYSIKNLATSFAPKLNNFINSAYRAKENKYGS